MAERHSAAVAVFGFVCAGHRTPTAEGNAGLWPAMRARRRRSQTRPVARPAGKGVRHIVRGTAFGQRGGRRRSGRPPPNPAASPNHPGPMSAPKSSNPRLGHRGFDKHDAVPKSGARGRSPRSRSVHHPIPAPPPNPATSPNHPGPCGRLVREGPSAWHGAWPDQSLEQICRTQPGGLVCNLWETRL